MGRLERHLDTELIARVRAGVRHPPAPVARQRQPRSALTYRPARRAQARELGVRWPGLPATTHALGLAKTGKQYKPNGEKECKRRRMQSVWPLAKRVMKSRRAALKE